MNVFISWSGSLSKQVAISLKKWIENTLQGTDAWMSNEDIEKGTIWFNEIKSALKDTSVGILCLTKDNLNSPWILFEAGALSKGLSKSRVCPLLIDLGHADLGQPLSQFNGSLPKREDMLKLITLINKENKKMMLKDDRVTAAFEKWWPSFEEEFMEIVKGIGSVQKPVKKTSQEMLSEILEISRSVQSHLQSQEAIQPVYINPNGWQVTSAVPYKEYFEQRYNTPSGKGLLGNFTFTVPPMPGDDDGADLPTLDQKIPD